MKSLFSIVVFSLFVLTIFGRQIEKTNEIISISSGTSFGRCIGYCRQSIEIIANPLQLNVLREANFNQASYPPVHVGFLLEQQIWTKLVGLVDLKTIENLDERIGCPDCADGGAEWIQIDTTSTSKRITFENGRTVQGTENLIEQLRDLRQTYLSKV